MKYGTEYTKFRICSTHIKTNEVIYGSWAEIHQNQNAIWFDETIEYYNEMYPMFEWNVKFK